MYESSFHVPYYGLAPSGAVKQRALLEMIQEAASLHASSLGVGVGDLLARGLTWVLRSYRLEISEPPAARELLVRTWYEPYRDLFSTREFSVHAQDGSLLASAWSSWILLDVARAKPVRLSRGLPEIYFASAEPTGERHDAHLPDVAAHEHEASFDVRGAELDINGHTNNTVFLEWAAETLPAEQTERGASLLEIEYLLPVARGRVVCRAQRIGASSFAHAIVIASTGELAARAVTEWR